MKGLYDNEMKLEFLSKSSNEAFARITVAAFVSQLDPTIEEISDIKNDERLIGFVKPHKNCCFRSGNKLYYPCV